MKLYALALLAVSVMGTAQCPTHDAVCDTRANQVMQYMVDHYGTGSNAISVEDDNLYGPEEKLALEREENRYEKLEAWARTLPDPADRRAWVGVIQFYEDNCKEAYSEWRTHKMHNEYEAYVKHQKECDEATTKAAKLRPIPTPPINTKGKP